MKTCRMLAGTVVTTSASVAIAGDRVVQIAAAPSAAHPSRRASITTPSGKTSIDGGFENIGWKYVVDRNGIASASMNGKSEIVFQVLLARHMVDGCLPSVVIRGTRRSARARPGSPARVRRGGAR